MTTIEQLLSDRANAMAVHDGVAAGVVHFHGAANQLQAELLSARDRLIHAPVGQGAAQAEPDQAVAPPPAEEVEKQPAVETEAEPPEAEGPAHDAEERAS